MLRKRGTFMRKGLKSQRNYDISVSKRLHTFIADIYFDDRLRPNLGQPEISNKPWSYCAASALQGGSNNKNIVEQLHAKANLLLLRLNNNQKKFQAPTRPGTRGSDHAHTFWLILTGKILKIEILSMKEWV